MRASGLFKRDMRHLRECRAGICFRRTSVREVQTTSDNYALTVSALDRKVLSKQLPETLGDGVNQHFELPFTLLFNSPMQGRLTTDGLLVQPIKGLSWLDGMCLSSGGIGIVQRPDKVVKFSKEAARNMRKMQCGATMCSVATNSASS